MIQRIITIIFCLLFVTAAFALLRAETKEQQKTIVGKDGAEMVLIPDGEFQMGSNHGEDDEKPVHTVHLDRVCISPRHSALSSLCGQKSLVSDRA